jgi:hypothetical protein
MDKKQLQKERNELFDENFNHKQNNLDKVLQFCQILRDETGVQVCNIAGGTYEYLPQIYRSVLNKI